MLLVSTCNRRITSFVDGHLDAAISLPKQSLAQPMKVLSNQAALISLYSCRSPSKCSTASRELPAIWL